jgi:hypothetical protein
MRSVAVVLAAFALVALLLAWSRWLARRRPAAIGHLAMGLLAGWSALMAWSVASSLDSYERVVPGQPIAELYVEQTGSQRFRGTLTRLPAGRVQVFELQGDEWRLEARTLEWRGWAAELGIGSRYRLERFLTRARPSVAVDAGASVPGTSRFQLATDAGDDLWAKARTRPAWARHVEGGHADGPWQPIEDEALYTIWLSGTTLRVEPTRPAPDGESRPAG